MKKGHIEALLRRLVETGRLNSAGFIRVNCPFCPSRKGSPDTNQAFGYNPVDEVARCFRCGFRWAKKGKRTRVSKAPKQGASIDTSNFEPLIGCPSLPVPFQCYRYLCLRGIYLPEISAGDLHYVVAGREQGRVVIPHKHPNGDWWGYTARQVPALLDTTAKATAPRGMQDDGYKVFNQVALTVDTQCPVLVMEGAIDTLRYLPDAIACLGKADRKLVELLSTMRAAQGFMRPIVVCLDGDAQDEQFAVTLQLRLRGFNVVRVELPAGKDPDTVDAQRLIDVAFEASLFGRDTVFREAA